MKIYEKCSDCFDGIREFDDQDSIAVAVKCSYCDGEGKLEVEPDVLAKEFALWLDDYKPIDDLFTQFLKEKKYETEN